MGSDDSDNDQGFVPMKMEIKADTQSQAPSITVSNPRPLDFQGRYIFGQGLFKKQPPEAYTRFSHYIQQQKYFQNQQQTTIRQEPKHPYEQFIKSNNYKLVYSRFKEKSYFSPDDDNFTSNQVDLSHVLSQYNEDHYSVLKNFQFSEAESSRFKELEFDSRFESGNLFFAFKSRIQENHYTLFLQNDTNTNGYNQWFYFSLKNAEVGIPYTFKIVNLRKKHSFFKQNMKISIFSRNKAIRNNGAGWFKLGNNIRYEKSEIKKASDKKYKFYSLTFKLTFEYDNDYISIAMNPPYTYSRLIHHLKICETIVQESQIQWRKQVIAHTIANNAVPYLTITLNQKEENVSKKKCIIFLARQHPGETWSSYLMQQILYNIAQNHCSSNIKQLLKKYIFKVFPMINVDGVIYGNFRCDIGGFDLNRNWKDPDRILHPQICAIRQQIQKIQQQNGVACVFDLHGHSKQYNIFCYTCKNDVVTSRILPYMIGSASDVFHFPFCTFGISKYKETTARAVIYNITHNENVLTIENSFFGSRINKRIEEFSPGMFKKQSVIILQALYRFLEDEKARKQAQEEIKKNLKQFLSYEKKFNENDSGSDSDPLADQINIKERIKNILPKSLQQTLVEKFEIDDGLDKKKTKKNTKKPANNKKYETLKPNKIRSPKQEQETKIEHTFLDRQSFTQYKRKSKELQSSNNTIIPMSGLSQQTTRKPIQEEIVSYQSKKNRETHLPFYLRQKNKLMPIKLKNDSLEMFKAAYQYESMKKEEERQLQEQNRQRNSQSLKGTNNRFIKIPRKRGSEQKEQFPLLCVLSENKKKSELSKYINSNETRTPIQLKEKKESRKLFRTYLKNEKLERMKKTHAEEKVRQKQNATLISKVWRDNVARYGKNLNVFLGDMKGI